MSSDQIKAWRKALAEKARQRRNQRGRRSRDPYRRGQYLGVRVQPRRKDGGES